MIGFDYLRVQVVDKGSLKRVLIDSVQPIVQIADSERVFLPEKQLKILGKFRSAKNARVS